jgi:F-type H+/Na+-transporting ATPase subunit alpha
MAVGVNPDEISAILKQQLAGFKTESELEEVGTVLQVGDGIARVYGLTKTKATSDRYQSNRCNDSYR